MAEIRPLDRWRLVNRDGYVLAEASDPEDLKYLLSLFPALRLQRQYIIEAAGWINEGN